MCFNCSFFLLLFAINVFFFYYELFFRFLFQDLDAVSFLGVYAAFGSLSVLSVLSKRLMFCSIKPTRYAGF